MKLILPPTLTILVILSFIQMTAAFVATDFKFIINAGQPSVFIAEYSSSQTTPPSNLLLESSLFLPKANPSNEYTEMQCLFGNSFNNFSKFKLRPMDFTKVLTAFESDFLLNSTDVLGDFKIICSFFAPADPLPPNTNVSSEITLGPDVILDTRATAAIVANYKPSFFRFSAYVADYFSLSDPTKFLFSDISSIATYDILYVTKPSQLEATSISEMEFNTSNNVTADCDAYWDDILIANSVSVVLMDINTLKFTFKYLINNANTIRLECQNISGVVASSKVPSGLEMYLPTVLKISNSSTGAVYTIADTEARRSIFPNSYY